MNIAVGSILEVESQIIIAKELKYISSVDFKNLYRDLELLRKSTFNFRKALYSY